MYSFLESQLSPIRLTLKFWNKGLWQIRNIAFLRFNYLTLHHLTDQVYNFWFQTLGISNKIWCAWAWLTNLSLLRCFHISCFHILVFVFHNFFLNLLSIFNRCEKLKLTCKNQNRKTNWKPKLVNFSDRIFAFLSISSRNVWCNESPCNSKCILHRKQFMYTINATYKSHISMRPLWALPNLIDRASSKNRET